MNIIITLYIRSNVIDIKIFVIDEHEEDDAEKEREKTLYIRFNYNSLAIFRISLL